MSRFSRVSVQLEDASPEVCVAAFKNGLRCGSLNKDLTRRSAKDMMDLRARVQEFILVEQDEQTKKDRDNWRTQPEVTTERGRGSKDQHPAQTPRPQRPAPYPSGRQGPQSNTWHRNAQPTLENQGGNASAQGQQTKLNAPLSTILRAMGQTNVVQYPRPPRRPPANVDTTKWCDFHKAMGHTTDNCWTLGKEIERLIKAGHLANFVSGENTQSEEVKAAGGGSSKGNEVVEDLGAPAGSCSSIAGGFGCGRLSCRGRKRYVEAGNSVHKAYEGECWLNHTPITFSPRDFDHVIPHDNDPIVVTLRVNNYVTKKVFLDQGSSADIIYGDAFERLGLKESDLKPYTGCLVGFTGDRAKVRGYVELATAFGEGEFVKKFQVKYLVIPCKATYNVLLGRDTLNKVCAIVSTAHLTVKYPACNGKIGIIRVDQEAARACYAKSQAL
ncbi:uncharacterized protein LOC130743890 [Lotus japonicus]|uniref:uncharacterized protein LOC130743890 n=1 Tax=Lotus japonicus TaxID=34305 RepID=UPI0025866F8A|nr:uncharacterized protein LOC130743890 [Lotus japonicus]